MVLQKYAHRWFCPHPLARKTGRRVPICLAIWRFECSGKCVLANHAVEGGGPVFSCRYDIVAHVAIRMTKLHKGSVFFDMCATANC